MDKPSFERLGKLYKALVASDLIAFVNVKNLKSVTGVYVIYGSDGEILYIGSTNNFNVRFGTDLKHETTHTLTRKLIKDGTHSDRKIVVLHYKNHYRYRIISCENKREAEALEHFAIWMLAPKYNK